VKKNKIIGEIESLDKFDDDEQLQEGMRVRRVQLLEELRHMSERQTTMLKQKSRVKWIGKGDMNNKFFHSRLRWRSINNDIKGLLIEGERCEEPEKVKCEVKKYFENRFQAQQKRCLKLDGVQFCNITATQNEKLSDKFREEEILEAVNQCAGTRSPSPDGFNFQFIKHNWDILGGDFIKAIHYFHETGYIPKGCNASFIVLVPKRDISSNLGDYRPISLVGYVYKILAKILANRIKEVLHNVTDKNQSTFLRGRGLLDNVLTANETVDFLRKEKSKGVIVKVDFEKAYDSVEWDFLEYMMGRLCFNYMWIYWIKMYLSSATVSVLINGSPTKEFKPRRGLRQGDPLAPFLFLIVVEGLAGLVREATRVGLLDGIGVGSKAFDVKLLQFADDTLFFCQPKYQCILTIKVILRSFEVVSGLKVNFHKSQVGAIGVDDVDLNIFSNCLNCGRMEFPFKYLGITIRGNPRKEEFWRPIIHKIRSKLFTWKG